MFHIDFFYNTTIIHIKKYFLSYFHVGPLYTYNISILNLYISVECKISETIINDWHTPILIMSNTV